MKPVISIVHDIPTRNSAGGIHRYTNETISVLEEKSIALENYYLSKGEFLLLGKKRFGTATRILQYMMTRPHGKIIHSMSLNTLVRKSNYVTIPDIIQQKFPEIYPKSTFYKKYIERRLKKALKINMITLTSSVKEDIIKKYNVDSERISVVYPYIEPWTFKFTGNSPYSDSEKTHLVTVTDFDPRKDLTPVIKAVNETTEAELCVIGSNPSNSSFEEKYRKMAGENKRIKFLGRVPTETLVNYLSHSDFLIHNTLDEGFGFTPLEAMSCGVTPIVPELAVFKETLGNDALYFANDNKISVTQIKEIIERPSINKKSATTLLARAGLFSMENFSNQLIEAYNKFPGVNFNYHP